MLAWQSVACANAVLLKNSVFVNVALASRPAARETKDNKNVNKRSIMHCIMTSTAHSATASQAERCMKASTCRHTATALQPTIHAASKGSSVRINKKVVKNRFSVIHINGAAAHAGAPRDRYVDETRPGDTRGELSQSQGAGTE